MCLPAPLKQQVESALGGEITRRIPASGGCINNGARLDTRGGSLFFLQWNEAAVYRNNGEEDLPMTELLGGFGRRFCEA